MNVELKALLDLVFDCESLVAKLVAKKNFFDLLPQVFSVLTSDVPRAIQNWSDLSAEVAALPGSAAEADLASYVQQKFAGAVDDAKAKAILNAVLKLIVDVAQDALALQSAIKG